MNPVPIQGPVPNIGKSDEDLIKEIQQLKQEITALEKQYTEAEAEYKVKVEQRNKLLSQIAQIISQQTNQQINPESLTTEMIQQYISTIQQQIQVEVQEIQKAIQDYKNETQIITQNLDQHPQYIQRSRPISTTINS